MKNVENSVLPKYKKYAIIFCGEAKEMHILGEKIMKKKTIIGVSVGAVAFVALLLVATFYDLQINVALGNKDSVFGQVFRLFGELTGWIIVPIAGAILFAAVNKDTKLGRVLAVAWAVITFVGWLLSIKYIMDEFTGDSYIDGIYGSPYSMTIIYDVIFALAATPLTLFIAAKAKKETIEKLVYFAIAMLIALALSQLVVTVMKNIWTRQRFRNLGIGNGGDDSRGFTPWYVPGLGKNKAAHTYYVEDVAGMRFEDAYKSFPSGHTAGAAMSLVIVMLPDLFKKLKKFKPLFIVVAVLYTVAVAISRIVNRAHYLSDVLFGGTIGFLSVWAGIAIANALKGGADKKDGALRKFMKFLGGEVTLVAEAVSAQTEVPAEDNGETTEEQVSEAVTLPLLTEEKPVVVDVHEAEESKSDGMPDVEE